VQGLWKSALVARMAPPRWRSSPRGNAARDPRPCSATWPSSPGPTRGVVDRNLALLSAVGSPPPRAPRCGVPARAAEPGSRCVPRRAAAPSPCLHPGAGREDKTWGEERFATLAKALHARRGLHSVISWGPGDRRRAERLAALLPGASRPPLLDFAGLARLAPRRASSSAATPGRCTSPTRSAYRRWRSSARRTRSATDRTGIAEASSRAWAGSRTRTSSSERWPCPGDGSHTAPL
jgi:ADP-heptose:LPS heptosyltransferase